MDGLALLCNLYADGPLSLGRLRSAGVRTLAELARVSPASLAAILKASPAQTARFLVEAHGLEARLSAKLLRDAKEEGGEDAAASPGPTRTDDASGPGPAEPPWGRTPEVPRTSTPRLRFHPPRKPQAFDLAPTVSAPGAVASEGEPGEDSKVVSAHARGPSAAPAPVPAEADVTGTPLRAGEIEGLDSRSCRELVALGVRTYKALVDLASLNLARRSGIPYTRLLDLRHRARAFLERRLLPAHVVSAAGTRSRSVASEREVELTPHRDPREPTGGPRASAGSYRASRVFAAPSVLPQAPVPTVPPVPTGPSGSAPGSPPELEDPGVAGPFV